MNSERDPIDRLLRESLPGLEAELPVDGCLDPDVLAAWSDGTLTADERVKAESHAAGCSRCQAVLSAMARIEPASPRHAWWTPLWTVRWLVPLGTVAALAVWIALPRQTSPPAVQATMAQQDGRPISIPETSAAIVLPGERDAQTDSRERARALRSSSAATEPVRAPSAAGDTPTRQTELRRDRSNEAKSLDALASPAELIQAEPVPGQAARRAAPPLAAVGGVTAGAPSAPPPPAPAEAAKSAARPAGLTESVTTAAPPAGFTTGRASAPGLFDVMSPNTAVRWRFGGTGAVQRSTDGGTTWTSQPTGTTTPVSAGWAPSPTICWLVGRAGTVLLSTDGATWQLRPFPEGVDLVSVRATDANNASVTTVDGRRFSTVDGGVTWSPPQESSATPFYQ